MEVRNYTICVSRKISYGEIDGWSNLTESYDIKTINGGIRFKGTYDEVNEFMDKLPTDESLFKITGLHHDKEAELIEEYKRNGKSLKELNNNYDEWVRQFH